MCYSVTVADLLLGLFLFFFFFDFVWILLGKCLLDWVLVFFVF